MTEPSTRGGQVEVGRYAPPTAAAPRRATAAVLRPSTLWIALGVVLVLVLRFLALDRYPASADEGGWPLSVRRFVEYGELTFDFYKAPGFHWLLWLPMKLFGATIATARTTSAVAGLVGLFFFNRIARRALGSAGAAWSATLLLGASYAAIALDRRALIEPLLLPWMLALTLVVMRRRRGDGWLVALCTAGLLLTKASGIFLLPVLALVALVGDGEARTDDASRAGTVRVIAGLAGGVAVAAATFLALYFRDPVNFMAGWVTTIVTASTPLSPVAEATVPHLGRFGIDPNKVIEWVRHLAADEPFLFAFGLAGAARALFEGRQRTMALWLLAGAGFLLAQTYVLDNHLATLLAPMALLTAWLLVDLDRTAPVRRPFGVPVTWCRLVGLMIVLFGAARAAGTIALKRDATRPATRWLAEHVRPDDRVLGAPYLLMRVPAHAVEFVRLPQPYLPEPAALDSMHVSWLVTDPSEWETHIARFGGTPAQLADALARCCDRVSDAGGVTVYHVRSTHR